MDDDYHSTFDETDDESIRPFTEKSPHLEDKVDIISKLNQMFEELEEDYEDHVKKGVSLPRDYQDLAEHEHEQITPEEPQDVKSEKFIYNPKDEVLNSKVLNDSHFNISHLCLTKFK